MPSRFTKKIPKYVYFWDSGDWINGPYVTPQKGRECRKFELVEVGEQLSNVTLNGENVDNYLKVEIIKQKQKK